MQVGKWSNYQSRAILIAFIGWSGISACNQNTPAPDHSKLSFDITHDTLGSSDAAGTETISEPSGEPAPRRPIPIRREAVAALQRLGASVKLNKHGEVIVVNLATTEVTDADLHYVSGMEQLLLLNLDGTNIGDEALAHLKGLSSLKILRLARTRVTDDGLRHLKGLKSLQQLYLEETGITDKGVEHLKELSNPSRVYLMGARVTNAGRHSLQQKCPNCRVKL